MDELEGAYTASKGEYKAARDKIAPNYQTSANELNAEYERNKRNFNQQAAITGINTGTASQAELAQNNGYQRSYGDLRTAQSDAQAEMDRQTAALTAQYQNSIKTAIADNDYQRAAALLDEYNNGYQRDMTNAQVLAEFGDFSGFEGLYGADAAANMKEVWRMQNPDLAYNLGQMTAEEYRNATGKYPAGYTPPAPQGGVWYSGGTYREEVAQLQRSINAVAGAGTVVVDGIFGNQTANASKQYEAQLDEFFGK